MIFCRYCGTKLPDNSLFCLQCGSSLANSGEAVTGLSSSPILQQPLSSSTGQQEHSQEKDGERQEFVPVPPLSGQPAPTMGNVPVVQGVPQVGTVPSIPLQGIGMAAKASVITAGSIVKIVAIVVVCAAVVVAGVKIIPPIITRGGINVLSGNATHKVPPVVTVKMPPTETTCPSSGQARAAIIRPLAPGKGQNIVYVKSIKSANSTPISSTLYRYDVTTGKTTQVLQVENVDITDAQVSADEQWVIFISEVGSTPAIQMVRMDGQGLQTLYCMPPTQFSYEQVILGQFLSPDLKHLAFYTGLTQDQGTFNILDMTNGTIQPALQPQTSIGNAFYEPAMWLNNTQLYLWRFPIMYSALFLFNIQNGPNQPVSALKDVADSPSLISFDVSPDHTKLFIGLCYVCGQGVFVGPSSILVQPATGTAQRTLYTGAKDAIMTLLAASSTTLLFSVENSSEDPNKPADSSQNGIWKIHTDGSGLTRLSSSGVSFGRYDHQDVSNDSKWYILSSSSMLFYSSVNGGTSTMFASANNASGASLVAVGWTDM